ncbi:hypothetical protein PybrP1_004041 [[Pythium] brassicae (nom. inval.)]|nr:hypothetical protein PybrP1_004041 [[Pythium] brassicae (nom. inval.)]
MRSRCDCSKPVRLKASCSVVAQAARQDASVHRLHSVRLGHRTFVKTDGPDITVVGTYVDDRLVTATSFAHVDAFLEQMQVLELKGLGWRWPLPPISCCRLKLKAICPAFASPSFSSARSCGLLGAPAQTPRSQSIVLLNARANSERLVAREANCEPGEPARWCTYTNSNFAGDREDRKSVGAVIVRVNGVMVEWMCMKQSLVAMSIAEGEFISAAVGSQAAMAVRELLQEVELTVKTPLILNMDNQAAILEIDNEASSASVKHVDIKRKFLRDYPGKGVVTTEHRETARCWLISWRRSCSGSSLRAASEGPARVTVTRAMHDNHIRTLQPVGKKCRKGCAFSRGYRPSEADASTRGRRTTPGAVSG